MVSILTYPIKLILAVIMSILGFFFEGKKLLEENNVSISGPSMKGAFNAGKNSIRDTADEFLEEDEEQYQPAPKPKPKTPVKRRTPGKKTA